MIRQWPEVFEDLQIEAMPLHYINFLTMKFKDGRVWEIDIKSQVANLDSETVIQKLTEILDEYKSEIEDIDFNLNTEQLKQDIKNSTNTLL